MNRLGGLYKFSGASNVVGEQAFRQRRYEVGHKWEPSPATIEALREALVDGLPENAPPSFSPGKRGPDATRGRRRMDDGDGDLAGPLLLGVLALVLTVIVALIAYEAGVGRPIHAVATDLYAIGGRVAVADLDRFEVEVRGDRADLRAVRRDGRRVDVALGIDPGDACAMVGLIERVVGGRHSETSG